MISTIVAPPLRRRSSSTVAFLLPSRGVDTDALFVAPSLAFAFLGATGAACGAAAGVSTWMAFQIRPAAVLRSVNFLTSFSSPKGGAPAKAFQTSAKRVMGHSAVVLVSSFSVANASALSCEAGGASWAVLLFSLSMVTVPR